MMSLLVQFSIGKRVILAITLSYAIGFYAFYVARGDYEFVLYLLEFLAFIIIACALVSRTPSFPTYILALLSLVGLLHVAGGGVEIGGVRLYDLLLLPLYDGPPPELAMLKYDQFVHLLGFGAITLVVHWFLASYATELRAFSRGALTVLAGMGLGALNEISEFSAVVVFSRTGVGGYYNIALDLVFNLVGALAAVLIAEAYTRFCQRRKHLLDFESHKQIVPP